MKLKSFNCTIEVSKDENGYSNNYYVDITEQGVSVSVPYIKQNHEQAKLVNELINQFIDDFNHINRRIDGFNKDMKLEEYSPKTVKTEESVSETTEESAVTQSSRGVSELKSVAEQIGKDYEEAVEEKSLAKTIEDNVIESLGLK